MVSIEKNVSKINSMTGTGSLGYFGNIQKHIIRTLRTNIYYRNTRVLFILYLPLKTFRTRIEETNNNKKNNVKN